jgi:hypothetical protein
MPVTFSTPSGRTVFWPIHLLSTDASFMQMIPRLFAVDIDRADDQYTAKMMYSPGRRKMKC